MTKRLLRYLHPYRYHIFLALLLLICAKAIEAYIPIYIGFLTEGIFAGKPLTFITRHSFIVLGLLLFTYLLDAANVFLKNWIGQKWLHGLRVEIFERIQQLPLALFSKKAVGTLMTATIHDVDQINQMFADSLIPLLGSVILFVSAAIFVILYDWRLAFILFLTLPAVIMLTNHFRIHQKICYDRIRAIIGKLNAFVQERLMGAALVRRFGRQEREKERFDKINRQLMEANIRTIDHFAYFFAGINFAQSFSLILLFVVLVALPKGGEQFEAGAYFTYSLYVLMLFRPLADLAERYNLLQAAFAGVRRIFSILDEPEEAAEKKDSPAMREIESIEFRDVWFAYRDEEWVLKGLSFSIEKGDSLAIVGLTGAGKTSIMNLLLRFYEWQKGSILLNGRDIREYSFRKVRRLFGVCLQEPEIFSGTIKDNITFFDRRITEDRIMEVIGDADLCSFIDKFPDGVNFFLAERGKMLSQGEKQLIALARAIFFNRSFLFLDEATANIDSEAEVVVRKALRNILRTRTAIVIAHRLSTIKDVKKIIVLHNGKVVEEGTHLCLLRERGMYAKLYRLQFAD